MKLIRSGILAALALVLAAGAQPPPRDPEATFVPGLIVTPAQPGPAWWKVEDADSVVYVMGLPGTTPRNLRWDATVLERRLRGAHLFILPVSYGDLTDVGAEQATPFEDDMEPALKARFAAAREGIDRPANRYRLSNPASAAKALAEDFRRENRLSHSDFLDEIERIVTRSGTPAVEAQSYAAVAPARIPEAVGMACLEGALAAVEAGPEPYRRAAEAWARGDIRGALGAPRGDRTWRCTNPPESAIRDHALAIAGALRTTGRAVAVVPLTALLAEGGVIEQLRAQGFKVTDPASLEAASP